MVQGICQYLSLGAGLGTFVLRHPALASSLSMVEMDQPDHVACKQYRLNELGFKLGNRHHFLAVDFRTGDNWIAKLPQASLTAHNLLLLPPPAFVVVTV